jgi:toxin YoeB
MEIILLTRAEDELKYFSKIGDKKTIKKIKQLLISIQESPYSGIGKPEPLKHEHSGKWSRRINLEHRLVYKISDDKQVVYIYSIKSHY